MQLFDAVTASATRRTSDGYLVADVRAARTGIQEYRGYELERPDLDVVRVYRPEAEVFSRDSLATYAYKPATNDHPSHLVTADTWKADSIGQIGEQVVRDGDHVRVPLVLMDAAAIADYERGKCDLSMGYEAEIVFQDGQTPDGQPYDAIQKNIRINHIALVDTGRAGSTRIGDKRGPGAEDHAHNPKGGHPMADVKKVIVDGLTIETTEQGAQVIEKLQVQLTDAGTAHSKQLADKDAELAKKDAEIDSLKAKVLTDADIDARVQERADLIAVAKSIADADYSGKSAEEIRAAVVKAKFGDAAVADKSPDYVKARFDILVEDSGNQPDPVRQALADNKQTVTDADGAYAAYVQSLRDGTYHKQEAR